MLIPLCDLYLIYRSLLKSINVQSVSVLIFVALDVDAVCALRILTRILKSQNVQFNFCPVSTYSELQEQLQKAKALTQVRMLWFINCGGQIDLTEKWFIAQTQTTEVFLLDVNMPIYHANIAHKRIYVVDDGESGLLNCPTVQEVMDLQELLDMEDEEEDLDLDEGIGRKSRNQSLKKMRDQLLNKHTDYYGRQYAGCPSSMIAFRIAREAKKINNDVLWMGIVGLTSLFLQSRISKQMYQTNVEVLKSEMSKYNITSASSINKELGQISSLTDYRLTLLRHWSLYESIMYSPYVVMKMRLWSEVGKRKLDQFLAEVGMSLYESKQLYKYMSSQSKATLHQQILNKAESFHITQISFESFVRQVDHSLSLSASDVVHVLTSVLQAPQKDNSVYSQVCAQRKSNFLRAYEMADHVSIDEYLQQIENCKKFMKTLITEAISVVEREIPAYSFIYVKFQNDSKDKQVFEHPYSLIKLGYTIMGIFHEKALSKNKSNKRFMPLVISIENQQSDTCTLVGVGTDIKSSFGRKFNQVSSKIKIKCKHDSFLGSIIVLKKDDVTNFVGKLFF